MTNPQQKRRQRAEEYEEAYRELEKEAQRINKKGAWVDKLCFYTTVGMIAGAVAFVVTWAVVFFAGGN